MLLKQELSNFKQTNVARPVELLKLKENTGLKIGMFNQGKLT